MKDRIVRASKFLSYVLRHNPDALGLSLDPGGWADVDTLLERARAEGRAIDRALLERVIAHGEKTRLPSARRAQRSGPTTATRSR